MIENLTYSEEFFINVHRSFEFLRIENGYIGDEFVLNSREERWISYRSYLRKKKITIIERDGDEGLDFFIETKTWLGWNRKTLNDYFDNEVNVQSIKRLVEIIKENKVLMKDLTNIES